MGKRNSVPEKTKAGRKRLSAAKKDFDKIQEEIEPFLRRRRFREYSTAGDWQQTSTLHQRRET